MSVDDVRRRIQQQTHRHRGRKGDPLYGIGNLLRAGRERLTGRQWARLQTAFAAHEVHISVKVAYQCAQDVREMLHQDTLGRVRRLATRLIEALPTCPIPEVARLGRTLRSWKTTILAYFEKGDSSNDGTEAVNWIIELSRRIAHGFRNFDHYGLRILLIASGLDASPRTQL